MIAKRYRLSQSFKSPNNARSRQKKPELVFKAVKWIEPVGALANMNYRCGKKRKKPKIEIAWDITGLNSEELKVWMRTLRITKKFRPENPIVFFLLERISPLILPCRLFFGPLVFGSPQRIYPFSTLQKGRRNKGFEKEAPLKKIWWKKLPLIKNRIPIFSGKLADGR